jgi:hypothetical protein
MYAPFFNPANGSSLRMRRQVYPATHTDLEPLAGLVEPLVVCLC